MPRHAIKLFALLLLAGAAPIEAADSLTNAALPTLFLVGDSTVNNSSHGLQGWGAPIAYFFDRNKIRVENRAIGGRSSRSFLTEGRWDKVMADLKPGDFVLMQLGHNDSGSLTESRARASLKGIGDETRAVTNAGGAVEIVHTYGWYMRKYVRDTQARGATPIMVTLIPRNDWQDGKIPRSDESYAGWAKQVAAQEHIQVVDLNDLAARHYEQLGAEKLRADIFIHEHTHTSVEGARLNAACVVEGLRALPNCALAKFLLPDAQVELPPLPKPDFKPAFWQWAQKPPLGWNSYDTYGDSVTEQEVMANAKDMKEKLAAHGWQFIVVDFRWYDPAPTGDDHLLNRTRAGAKLSADESGRLTPAANRFPSAADGQGFKPLADRLHAMGLKFGIHVMRGIPRQSVTAAARIEHSKFTPAEAGNTNDICTWCPDMFGVRTNAAGQAWYDSIFRLYAGWGVDFVKVDDLSQPYHAGEIEMIRQAIDRCGRPIILSTSPGATPVEEGYHISANANMWRVSGDFWDKWPKLKEQFSLLARWAGFSGAGHRADADMIPLGHIAIRSKCGGDDHRTHFTPEEQRALITLWSIAASPLMLGMNLPDNDEATLALLTNDEVLAVDQTGRNAHQVFNHNGLIAWASDAPGSPDKFVALFNSTEGAASISVTLAELGLPGPAQVRDLWAQKNLGDQAADYTAELPPHGAALYRISVK